MALNKKYSLKNRYIFYNFQKLQKLERNKYLTLLQGDFKTFRINTREGDYPKTVFIVRKKEVKSAVLRNRIKRRASEAYRVLLQENKLNIQENYYCLIFILRKNILDMEFSELKSIIENSMNNS